MYENTHIYNAMLNALGLTGATSSAVGAQQMPDTGGPALEPWLVLVPAAALLAALGGLGLFVSTRGPRGPHGSRGREWR